MKLTFAQRATLGLLSLRPVRPRDLNMRTRVSLTRLGLVCEADLAVSSMNGAGIHCVLTDAGRAALESAK